MSHTAAHEDPAAIAARAEYPAGRWLIAVVVGLAAFMEVLDISIANVSLAHIAGSLSASQDEATWVLTAYLVANAIVLPASGWFSQVFGRKRYFIGSIVCFSIASLACGLAPSLGWLVVFRIIQGAAGGGLQPVAQAILADSFPPSQRSMAFSIYGIAVVFARMASLLMTLPGVFIKFLMCLPILGASSSPRCASGRAWSSISNSQEDLACLIMYNVFIPMVPVVLRSTPRLSIYTASGHASGLAGLAKTPCKWVSQGILPSFWAWALRCSYISLQAKATPAQAPHALVLHGFAARPLPPVDYRGAWSENIFLIAQLKPCWPFP